MKKNNLKFLFFEFNVALNEDSGNFETRLLEKNYVSA